MKLILRSDRKGLGKRGDIVEVSDGHARNFLLPKGHAFTATDGAVSQATAMRRARDLRDAQDRESAQTVASALVPKTIIIKVKAGARVFLIGPEWETTFGGLAVVRRPMHVGRKTHAIAHGDHDIALDDDVVAVAYCLQSHRTVDAAAGGV